MQSNWERSESRGLYSLPRLSKQTCMRQLPGPPTSPCPCCVCSSGTALLPTPFSPPEGWLSHRQRHPSLSPHLLSLAKLWHGVTPDSLVGIYGGLRNFNKHAHGCPAAALPSASPRLRNVLDHGHQSPKSRTPVSLIFILTALHESFIVFKKWSNTDRKERHSPECVSLLYCLTSHQWEVCWG